MVSFIIYEKNNDLKNLYIKVIKKFLYETVDYYEIFEFDKYNSEAQHEIDRIEGAKIYLIDLDDCDLSSRNLARTVRERGDFISPIILLTSKDRRDYIEKLNDLLYSSFIAVDDKIILHLMRALKSAYRIVTRYAVYTFSAYDEIYRIPYDDIEYIVKNANEDSVTIYTKDDSYLHFITIKSIEELLKNDPRFFKTHRSCILNLYNISSYDKKSNTVIFKNGMKTSLVSKYMKKKLTLLLKDFDNSTASGK